MTQTWIKKITSKFNSLFNAPLTNGERAELEDLRKQKRVFMPRSKVTAKGPSIFLVTIPKSATSYISHSLAKSLKYDHCAKICVSSYLHNFLSPEKMRDFQRGGMVAVSHMRPTDGNMEVLKYFGGKKIVVHVRDPRATLVSWFYFIEKTMQTAKQNNDFERQTSLSHLARPDTLDYFSLSRDEKIETLTKTFYHPCVDRITSWLSVADKDKDIECLFLSYEDLLKDEEGYFKRLTSFYGIDKKVMGPPKTTNPHFRQGTSDGWRKDLNQDQIRKLNEQMPAFLWQRFGWNPA